MILSAGYNIAGPEVEAALLAHPDVGECAVVGQPDEERGQIVAAFVVLRAGVEPGRGHGEAPAGSREGVDCALQVSRAPCQFVDQLPKTATGKIQRFRMRDSA